MPHAEEVGVAVVGAGQAGLAVSRELTEHGVEHVVLERGRIGQTWRDRWDSFCLVGPNWTVRLPGHPYDGDDPDGFMPREELVAFFERYAAAVGAPVREGVDVTSIERSDGFTLRTSAGDLHAQVVVLATGAYQRPHRPAGAATLPADVVQLDVEAYRSEAALPPGRVLVVGSGQSGCQIAEELHEAGRDVVLACGSVPWMPRRFGGHDLLWWVLETGFLDASVDSLPSPLARLTGNVLATGHGGGRDLHLRTLRQAGVTLHGHDGARAPRLRDVGAVIFTTGFRPDYASWLPWPDAFDELGWPLHEEGASTVVPGLYFVGVHFLRKRKSSLLIGVGEDAAIVARQVSARLG